MRFGDPDRVDDLDLTFGEDWTVETWAGPGTEGVHRLLHGNRPVGWTAPVPDGPMGPAGWIALLQLDGRRATVVGHEGGRPRTYPEPGPALDALQRAHADHRARAARAAAGVPHLALKRPTGWAAPSARGLGTPQRTTPGEGLLLLTWPAHPGVQELQHAGRPVGWTEEYDAARGTWTALIDSSIVCDSASGEPVLCPGPVEALALLRRALGERLTRW